MSRPKSLNPKNSRNYLFVICDENERVFYRKFKGRRHLLMAALEECYPNYSYIECYVLSDVTLSPAELEYRHLLSTF